MTAYLLTPEVHQQLIDGFDEFRCAHAFRPSCQAGAVSRCMCVECATKRLTEALAMLKAMKPVEPCAFRNPVDSYSLVTAHQKETNEFQYSDEFLAAHTEPLYALGDTA